MWDICDTNHVVKKQYSILAYCKHSNYSVEMGRPENETSGVARAQPMPGHSMGTTRTQAPPNFQRLAVWKCRRGVWGMLPQKILKLLSFLGPFWGYFRPYRRLELEHFDNAFATNMRARSVRSANMYTSRSGEHIDLVILKIQIAKLRSSISTPLRTFSAQFAIAKPSKGFTCIHTVICSA